MTRKRRQSKDVHDEVDLELEDRSHRKGGLRRHRRPCGSRKDLMEETNKAAQSRPRNKMKGDPNE